MRIKSIESIRFVSIIFIIIIHVSPYIKTIPGAVLNQVARFAVPYFFIVSGYFFCDKITRKRNDPIKLMTTYCARLFYIYMFWYAIYAIWPLISPENYTNISANGLLVEFQSWKFQFIENFKENILFFTAAGGYGFHLWYLPSLGIAILLLSVSLWLNGLEVGFFISIILYVLALLITPYRESCFGIKWNLDPRIGPFFSSLFVFIGAMFSKYNVRLSLLYSSLIAATGLFVSLAEVLLINNLYDRAVVSNNYVIGTVFYGAGVFLVAISTNNIGEKLRINNLGGLSLGIYVLHVLVIRIYESLPILPSSDAIKVVFVLLISTLMTIILSKIPLISKSVK